jgi:SagB-type dehydrogenase family enzyme
MIPIRDATTLSLLYHLNSEPWTNGGAYECPEQTVNYKEIPEAEQRISLPRSEDSALMQLLKRRSSCRQYASRVMPLQTVSTLLAGMYGVSRITTLQDGTPVPLRPTPSAGGVFPLEIYVLTQDVEDLPDGIHHYAVLTHSLETMRRTSLQDEQQSFAPVEPFIRNANLIVLIAAIFERTQSRYGPRGYRFILLEAGHAAQNLCLLATERGLGSLCMGGFLDAKLNRLLGFDGVHEAVLYGVAAGYPEEEGDPQGKVLSIA